MQISLSHSLFFFLVAFCEAAFSLHTHSAHISIRATPIQKRQVAQTAKRVLNAEVPASLKRFKIFQDDSKSREFIRNRYIHLLGQIDKVREPYWFSHDIKKEWIYKPDLRKHYFFPRVLRVPVIIQHGPVRYREEFANYIKGANEEFKLKEAARQHVPELDELSESEATKSGAKVEPKTASDDLPFEEKSPRRHLRGRRRSRKYSRKGSTSFNQFQTVPDPERTPPRTPVSHINSDPSTRLAQTGASSRSMSPIEETHTESGTSSEPFVSGQGPAATNPVTELSSALMRMAERHEALKAFQTEQMKKAAMRYVGHSQYLPPGQQQNGQIAEGVGLAPVRTKQAGSQEVSPDPTPRKTDDPTGVEADVSNPQTPTYRLPTFQHHSGMMSPGLPSSHSGSPGTPDISTPFNDPSPFISPPGLTPSRSHSSTGTTDPGSFRLPIDYADLLHTTRPRAGVSNLQGSLSVPSVARTYTMQPDAGVSVGWDDGRPSDEGIRKVQELAHLNDAGYAIYHDPKSPHQQSHVPFEMAHQSGAESGHSVRFPEIKAQDAALGSKAKLSGRRDTDLFSWRQNHAKAPLQDIGVQTSDTLSQPHGSTEPPNVLDKGNDHKLADSNDPAVAANAPRTMDSPPDSPVKKRKRPLPLTKPAQDIHSFLFPATKSDLVTPQMKGFKPSLRLEEDPNPDFDPRDPNSSPGLVFRRERLKKMIRTSSGRLRSLQDRLRSIPKSTSDVRESIIQAYRDHRGVSNKDSTDPRSAVATR